MILLSVLDQENIITQILELNVQSDVSLYKS